MPSSPQLVAELLTDALGLKLPPYQRARLDSGDLTDLTRRAATANSVDELFT